MGRKQQFGDPVDPAQVPDPVAESTFEAARLTWSWPDGTFHSGLRRLYRDLLELRRRWPALRDFENRNSAAFGRSRRGAFSWSSFAAPAQPGACALLFNLRKRRAASSGTP